MSVSVTARLPASVPPCDPQPLRTGRSRSHDVASAATPPLWSAPDLQWKCQRLRRAGARGIIFYHAIPHPSVSRTSWLAFPGCSTLPDQGAKQIQDDTSKSGLELYLTLIYHKLLATPCRELSRICHQCAQQHIQMKLDPPEAQSAGSISEGKTWVREAQLLPKHQWLLQPGRQRKPAVLIPTFSM